MWWLYMYISDVCREFIGNLWVGSKSELIIIMVNSNDSVLKRNDYPCVGNFGEETIHGNGGKFTYPNKIN